MKMTHFRLTLLLVFIGFATFLLAGIIGIVVFVKPFQTDVQSDSAPAEIRNSFKNYEKPESEKVNEIKNLVDQSVRTSDDDKREKLLKEVAEALVKRPDLIRPFIEFFIRKNGEEWYLDRGFEVMRMVGKKQLYDSKRIVEVIKSDQFQPAHRWQAIKCVTVMSDKIDERVLFDLLKDTHWTDVRSTVINFTMGSLADVTDRKKANRILRKCLQATAGVGPDEINTTLMSFTLFTDKNEDVFAELLAQSLPPHETVIVAVSLLKEKWPDDHPNQKIAEEASKKSALAKAFLQEYLDHRP